MMKHPKEEIYHQGQSLSCPVTPVMTAKDIADSPQSAARHFFVEVEHPVAGKLKYPATPYLFSATPSVLERPAPLLGQHNEEVFSVRSAVRKRKISVARPTRTGKNKSTGPLQGIRIADFSWAWAGSHATDGHQRIIQAS